MKRDFTHENFEDFLKRSADSLRMKAPDRVWRNLSKEANKRRRRLFFGISAFLLISFGAAYHFTDLGFDKTPAPTAQLQSQPVQKTNVTKPVVSTLQKPYANILRPNPVVGNKDVSSIENRSTAANHLTDKIVISPKDDKASENLSGINQFSSTVVDSYTEFDEPQIANKSGINLNETAAAQTSFPLTIESVINQYKANKKKKIETQLYFTPTISYRKLSENKSYLRKLGTGSSSAPGLHSSVSNSVTHKPDIGFELGFAAKYPLSNKLKLRSGVQFNVNRYDVKAFSAPLSVATIALNNGSRVDSLNTVSGYSNVQRYGSTSNWLQNLSFQISAPVGIEYVFSDNGKVQFGIGSTVQPTYVMGDRAYLITTDYKSYTQVPWLIRRWNVNTAFEAFVTLNSSKTKWQIGPQVRYQLLSSFISEYPVKENLFDFGLKVGLSLNK